ncbi:hypothetical protein F5Y09DRAFT_334589 [Xylaria sp. FL1042]|nr:hypothetical protein F5Y09DRAFT_334589 [Xylaria sp. FL1042]
MEKTKSSSPPTICLDVAIDHRIRRLCKPTRSEEFPEPSTHLSVLQRYGSRLGCETDEISVTTQLAGPAKTGGILVTLQQPRDNHPFEFGLDSVIEDCESLTALDELFRTASCGTLNVKKHVSLVDLLPFTPQPADTIQSRDLQDAFQTARLTICAKQPDVVLCAGKIWLPYEDRNLRRGVANQEKSDIKGELWKLESTGVGRPDQYDTVRLRGSGRGQVMMSKVNGFHPSYAVNYHPEHTNLKQLLLLSIVKTCGTYRGDWDEERWMDTLRTECRELVMRLRDEKQTARRSRTVADYAQIYSTIQQEFFSSIKKIESSQGQAVENIYDNILASKLSYKCNDASVVLRKVLELHNKGWSQTQNAENKRGLGEISSEVRHLVDSFTKQPLQAQSLRLQDVVAGGMRNLKACFTGQGSKATFDLEMMADVFLQMARSIEEILEDLLDAETTSYRGAGLSDQFTKSFQGLSLANSYYN